MPPLRARAPLDLDLEDRLIFGLTPVRFGYLAVGALAAYALGGHAGGPLGLLLALVLLGVAAAFAWVRWRGRPLDAWLLDVAVHARRNLEVEVDPVLLRRIRAPLRRSAPLRTIAVSASDRRAGATTVAIELGAALAMKGRRVTVFQRRQAPRLKTDASGVHAATGLRVSAALPSDSECVIFDLGAHQAVRRADLALVVVSGGRTAVSPAQVPVRAKHLEVIANRADVDVAGVTHAIPEDPSVPAAHAAREAVILQFPASRAAAAFRRLADAVDPARPSNWPPGSSEVPPAG